MMIVMIFEMDLAEDFNSVVVVSVGIEFDFNTVLPGFQFSS